MLLQMKIYLITLVYLFGGLFILTFPPRNFVQSGPQNRHMRASSKELNFQRYLNNDMLLAACELLVKSNPDLIRMVPLPPCTENNRTLLSLELRSDKEITKPGIFVIGAINAMSWGAANAVIELAEKLLYDANYQTPFFNDYDWYLIPMGNPDGVEFTQKMQSKPSFDVKQWSRNVTARVTTRPSYWFKNTDTDISGQTNDTCMGTHINRNFAFHWQDDVHATPERCCPYYPGHKPFSSNEAQAIRKYVDRLGDNINLAIHLHSSFVHKKESILFPWRYSLRQPSNFHTLQEVGEYAARQSRLPDGRLYEVHQSSYDERVAGTFADYVTGVVGVDLAYIIKPYQQLYPNLTDYTALDEYVNRAISAVLGLVRGWRSSTKQNTLSFFGRDVEF
ncbi:zinc carboxypeptidase-like [Plodia interpunctella]|uniref:zinc carboxypeptidase-like n=1 Tax=Plodia interpunctella TaxID=58824 RepID=UPI002367D868|nr:zinc carboxypeptidase-like [Plodia interpunctella]